MNALFKKAKDMAFSALPSSVAPENQYAKSYAAMLTLAVSADFELDVAEFQQASIFMEKDAVLTQTSMTLRAVEFFRAYTVTIKDVMCAESLDFPSIQTEMIHEVRECPAEYVHALRAVIAELRAISDPLEQAVFDRINL